MSKLIIETQEGYKLGPGVPDELEDPPIQLPSGLGGTEPDADDTSPDTDTPADDDHDDDSPDLPGAGDGDDGHVDPDADTAELDPDRPGEAEDGPEKKRGRIVSFLGKIASRAAVKVKKRAEVHETLLEIRKNAPYANQGKGSGVVLPKHAKRRDHAKALRYRLQAKKLFDKQKEAKVQQNLTFNPSQSVEFQYSPTHELGVGREQHIHAHKLMRLQHEWDRKKAEIERQREGFFENTHVFMPGEGPKIGPFVRKEVELSDAQYEAALAGLGPRPASDFYNPAEAVERINGMEDPLRQPLEVEMLEKFIRENRRAHKAYDGRVSMAEGTDFEGKWLARKAARRRKWADRIESAPYKIADRLYDTPKIRELDLTDSARAKYARRELPPSKPKVLRLTSSQHEGLVERRGGRKLRTRIKNIEAEVGATEHGVKKAGKTAEEAEKWIGWHERGIQRRETALSRQPEPRGPVSRRLRKLRENSRNRHLLKQRIQEETIKAAEDVSEELGVSLERSMRHRAGIYKGRERHKAQTRERKVAYATYKKAVEKDTINPINRRRYAVEGSIPEDQKTSFLQLAHEIYEDLEKDFKTRHFNRAPYPNESAPMRLEAAQEARSRL